MWLYIIAALLSGVDSLTPEQCDYVLGNEQEYECSYDSSTISFAAKNDYAKVYCEGSNYTCEDLPRFNLAKGLPLRSLGVSACKPSLLRCMYQVLNTTSIDHLTLTNMDGPLTEADVKHLQDLKLLMMFKASSQNSMPIEAIKALPQLRDLRVDGADFQLSPNMFQNTPTTLDYLALQSDGIRSIPVDAFTGLDNLRALNVWDNSIDEVKIGAFNGLNNLRALTLNMNELKYIEPGAFDSLHQLGSLQMTANKIKTLPDKLLNGLDRLENITIFMNRENLELANTSFANLKFLKRVCLKNSRIDVLPERVFQNSTDIERLELSKNNIANLRLMLFSGLVKLKYLDLSHNKLDRLPADIFLGLKQLEYLNLNRNQIESLPSNLFSSQGQLKELHLDHNAITTIAWTCFQGATKLDTVSLASNKLTLEPHGLMYEFFQTTSPLQYLTKLKKLNLSSNAIRTIFSEWSTVMVNLEYLDLSWNAFTEFDQRQMHFLSSSISVNLTHNNISHVILNPLQKGYETDLNPTKFLLLEDNPIICDCGLYGLKLRAGGLTPKGELKVILDQAKCSSPPNLKGDLIKQIPTDDLLCDLKEFCPKNCTCNAKVATSEFLIECYKLPSVLPDVKSNNISYYFTKTPTINMRLENQPISIDGYDIHTLNLSYANLVDVNFEPTDSLKILDLSYNKLENIPVKFLESSLEIFLSNNSFVCDCWSADSISTLKKYKSIVDYDKIACNNGELISNIDVPALCKTIKATVTAISTFAILAFLFIIAVILVYRYYNEIMLYLSTRWCKGCIHSVQKDGDKLYDVFISFAHKDFEFVEDVLLPKLENDFKQKVCVHYRDWEVGDYIPTQIVRSVENSRKTVIVLTKSFLESDWANLEFSAAHNRALQEGQARVILILLYEHVTKSEKISPELRAYINTNTYLVWGDPKFWSRLQKALPKVTHSFKFVDALKRHHYTEKSDGNGLNVQLNSDGKLINMAAKSCEKIDNLQNVV